jgi:hypothetical protein
LSADTAFCANAAASVNCGAGDAAGFGEDMPAFADAIGGGVLAGASSFPVGRPTTEAETESVDGAAALFVAVLMRLSIILPRTALFSATRRAVIVTPTATMIVAAIDIRIGVSMNRDHGRCRELGPR